MRLAREGATPEGRAEAMERVNPAYIARNHQVETSLAAAAEGADFGPFETLCEVLAAPFTERAGWEGYAGPAPGGNLGYKTFCGTCGVVGYHTAYAEFFNSSAAG